MYIVQEGWGCEKRGERGREMGGIWEGEEEGGEEGEEEGGEEGEEEGGESQLCLML